LQIKAKELQQPDVDIVSMVKRGANRIPFRITKEDKTEMLDLSKIGRQVFRLADVAPTVVGVVFAKSLGAENIASVIKTLVANKVIDSGQFTKTDGTGVVAFNKADANATNENTFVLRLSDEVALAISATPEFKKSMETYDWESTSFSEVMSKGAFAPSLCMAQDMLQRTMFNIMASADDNAGLAKLIGAATDEFKSYVITLAKGLPKTVFKADVALAKAAKKMPAEDAKDGGADDAAENADGTKKKTKKEEISANPVAGNTTSDTTDPTKRAANSAIEENPSAGNGTPTQTGTKVSVAGPANNGIEASPAAGTTTSDTSAIAVQKNAGDADAGKKGTAGERELKPGDTTSGTGAQQASPEMDKVVKSITDAFTKGLGDLKAHVDGAVAGLTKQVEGATALAKSANEAVLGTVAGTEATDQTGKITKSEADDSGWGGIAPLDTAYDRSHMQ
jgi:hypothetical protein